jgi:YfiH family protein
VPLERHSFAQQTHGDGVLVVPPQRVGAASLRRGARGVDALVTTAVDAPLVILVGDCVPVLLADPQAGVIAAAHAGRRGLVAGVVPRTVESMVAQGADASRIAARLGPSICGQCYELPGEMAHEVDAAVPGSLSTTRSGTPGADIAAGVLAQLAAAGVRDVAGPAACTVEDDRFYSHRRDGVTGRFAGVVWLTA